MTGEVPTEYPVEMHDITPKLLKEIRSRGWVVFDPRDTTGAMAAALDLREDHRPCDCPLKSISTEDVLEVVRALGAVAE